MKRIVIKGYTCPACHESLRVMQPGVYVRCSCGNLAMYGNPQDPVVVCNCHVAKLSTVDTIAVVTDNYAPPTTYKGGIIFANPKRGKMVGMTATQMDLVMPLLVFSKAMAWDAAKLLKALDAFEEYDKLISGDL